jgi:mersacidin/lichenicidin family type 2 lantibiotic
MSHEQIVRAWRDHEYWSSLGEAERAQVPDNPVGVVELMDAELAKVTGACTCYCTCEFTCGDSCYGSCDCTVYSGDPYCCS